MKLIEKRRIDKRESYDIEIKDTNCFFANGILVHNSNAGVGINRNGYIYAQSRENIITPLPDEIYKIKYTDDSVVFYTKDSFSVIDVMNRDKEVSNITKTKTGDNAGFAFFVESKKEVFRELFKLIDSKDADYITIFGEWAGGNIQKGVAINGLPKMFVVFDIKLSYDDIDRDSIYFDIDDIKKIRSVENNIYNIYDFPTFELNIDFNEPAESQNKIVELTLAVEEECPVGKAFGNIGVGEGIVGTYFNEDGSKYRFKSKGIKHSASKVKKLAEVNTEKLENIKEFVEYSVTENRLNQGIEKVFGIGCEIDIKRMGEFIKWVNNDVIKEELDTISDNGLEPKDIISVMSNKSRIWLLDKINTTF